MATWIEPKNDYVAGSQVTPAIFNELAENEKFLHETKITTSEVQRATVVSSENENRTNLTEQDTVMGAFGKIRKWFADLKGMAFKGTVATSDMDDGCVTKEKLASGAVTNDKLVSMVITEGKIASNAVTGDKVIANAITTAKISAGAVTNEKITSVSASKVTDLARVATTGNYNDLSNKPSVDLSSYLTKAELLNIAYPVGSIKIATSNTNPQSYLGGSWIPWGVGRVPVGVNTSESEFNSVEKMGGAKTHTLSVAEMPVHSHNITAYQISGNGYKLVYHHQENNKQKELATSSTGGGASHNNLQPYITCYMWKRTA